MIVLAPSHVTPATHVPVAVSQRWPETQSLSLAHCVSHVVPLQTYGAHWTVAAVGQFPMPSQLDESVSTPFVQLACTHVTEEPTYPVQDVRVLPSHWAAWHGSVAGGTGHAGRLPCGLPTTGVHVPVLPATSHASHSPVHALSQQTPSTQNPLTHAPFDPQDSPGVSVP